MNHQEPKEYSPEQLDIIRRTDEELCQKAAERVFGPPRREPDQVEINLDWEIPQHADDLLRFQVRISRLGQSSTTDFAIDLKKLAGSDLQKLHDILANRPHGYRLARAITWLLDISLKQQMPALNEEARYVEVQKLLLSYPLFHAF